MHNYSSTKANTFSYTYRRISYWYTWFKLILNYYEFLSIEW
jgi:hypothetical protein